MSVLLFGFCVFFVVVVCFLLASVVEKVAGTELRQSDSLGQFKRRLKTHLFGLWDHSAY